MVAPRVTVPAAEVAVPLEPPEREAGVRPRQHDSVAQPVEAARVDVALFAHDEVVSRAQQRREGPHHHHVQVEVDAAVGDEHLEPEHVGAVRGMRERSAEDVAVRVGFAQL